jgi:hypothetical protein
VYRDELADVALGMPASDTFATHLRACRECAAQLEQQRAIVQRMDLTVNALVRSEPSPALIGSITARARRSERPRAWRSAWPRAAMAVACAVAVCGVFFGLHTFQPPAPAVSAAAALTAWRSPTSALLKPHGSVLEAPLQDIWFDLKPRHVRSQRTSGETHDA